MDANETDASYPKPSGCCCTPSSERVLAEPSSVKSSVSHNGVVPALDSRMISLPGGTFLMGTDSEEGFPQDGEGPVRPVTLRAFSIDRYPVTNALFSQFVEATGYRTEAERFGWSFVFWLHIPPKRYNELVEDRVSAAPWWCKVCGA
ncbi:MAG: SUMF1/EgtB/PvdO family nonheme iron enzyme, partial [Acidobacteriaceae bacterium]